jgi:hypothetical protein
MSFQLSKFKVATFVLTSLVVPATAAHASTITFSDSVATQKTDFAKSVTLSQFDPSLGTLNSIFLELTGKVTGSIKLESGDAQPATATGYLASEISVENLDNSPLLSTLPTVTETQNLTAFDEVYDFGGTSGVTFAGLSDTQTKSKTLTASNAFTPFIGTGKITLPVLALAKSKATGSGNLLALINTSAGATLKLVYDYTSNKTPQKVPESPISASVLAGTALLMATRKKFWKQA